MAPLCPAGNDLRVWQSCGRDEAATGPYTRWLRRFARLIPQFAGGRKRHFKSWLRSFRAAALVAGAVIELDGRGMLSVYWPTQPVGRNVTLIVQLAPTPRALPHVFVCEYEGPPEPTKVTISLPSQFRPIELKVGGPVNEGRPASELSSSDA